MERDVENIINLLKSKDVNSLRAFVAKCPPASMKAVTVSMIQEYMPADTLLVALNMVVEDYSRGVAPELGVTLSKAIYLYSQELFAQDESNTHLVNAGRSATNCVIGLNALGRHEELISFADAAREWLSENSYGEVEALLFLYRIEAQIDLAHYDEAEALLHQPDIKALLTVDAFDRMRWETLTQRVKNNKRPATLLSSAEPSMSDKDVIIENRRSMLEKFGALADILPAEEAAMVEKFIAESSTQKELEKDVPDSLGQWAVDSQTRMDHLTDFLSGKPAKDVLRDYTSAIGRPDLAASLLGGLSSRRDDTEDSER